jgi:hypothetical protein
MNVSYPVNSVVCFHVIFFLAGGPKKESTEDDGGQEPEAPEPFEWPDDI